jgi:hypothetical protein
VPASTRAPIRVNGVPCRDSARPSVPPHLCNLPCQQQDQLMVGFRLPAGLSASTDFASGHLTPATMPIAFPLHGSIRDLQPQLRQPFDCADNFFDDSPCWFVIFPPRCAAGAILATLMTCVTNVRLLPFPTFPVTSQQPTVGKISAVAWNPQSPKRSPTSVLSVSHASCPRTSS